MLRDPDSKWNPAVSYRLPLRRLGLVGLVPAVVLLVYLRTLSPGLFAFDSPELVSGGMTLGIVHAPGYPVYLLLAHLFTLVPWWEDAYAVNLLSAVAATCAVFCLFCLSNALTHCWLCASAASLSFAFNFYVWSTSVIAEVYTLQALFLALILLAVWRWRRFGEYWSLVVTSIVVGLAAANNPVTILWWPGVLYLVITSGFRQRLHRRRLLGLVVGLVGGLAFISYLPLRSAAGPSFVYVGHFDDTATFHPLNLTQFRNLWWYLSGRQFDALFWSYSLADFMREIAHFIHRLFAGFLGIGFLLGIWGVFHLWRRCRHLIIGLMLVALPYTLFFIGYGAIDKETMFLPVYVIWAVFLAGGIEALLAKVPRAWNPVIFGLPLALLMLNYSYADVSNYSVPAHQAVTRLQEADPDALFLAKWDDAAAMSYQQLAHELRPDVTVVNVFFIAPEALDLLIRNALESGRPVFSTFQNSKIRAQFQLQPTKWGYRFNLDR